MYAITLTLATFWCSIKHMNAFAVNCNVKKPPFSPLHAQKVQNGDIVRLNIDLQNPSEEVIMEPLFDTQGEVVMKVGHGGHLPGLHEMVVGMEVGDTIENMSIDAGYGAANPDAIATLPWSNVDESIRSGIKVGVELFVGSGQKVRVTEVTDDTFTIDANPPLAGSSYKCKSVKVLDIVEEESLEVATVALGCFWGGELAYMREPGVISTKVGYTQGSKENPSYKEVCTGTTGHTEAIQIIFDPAVVTYERIIQLGLDRLGDSKYLLNQVGNDRGTQYRHGVYYHNDEQRSKAEKILADVPISSIDGSKCQTELKLASIFYDAEDYHQQYLLKGGQSAKKNAEETIRCYG
mmetsp:Transcript_2220/g.3038  ORF Transcript_2220/g.3038 Transcript_2220/m.3038 type:complete len:350 (-) Transcript_2220:24-1073(-)